MLEKIVEQSSKPICLMTHIICGFPSFDANWELLEAMDQAGVEFVELQFPFSEPVADGPLFAKANQESIENGTTIEMCFDFLTKVNTRFKFKTLMMGYYNTVYKYGEDRFCKRLADCGASGLIIPDIPLEESHNLRDQALKNSLDFIPLVAPTNTESRIASIASSVDTGFVYAVARKGVTGAKTQFEDNLEPYFTLLKKHFKVPIALGFGISNGADVAGIVGRVDIAVVGSAVLKTYLDSGINGVKELLSGLR